MRRLSLCIALAACKRHESPPPPPPPPAPADAIPKTDAPIALDGELHEPAWNARALRGVLTGDDGQQARPYSEVRLLHDDRSLYLGLYAADEDIRSRDAWELTIGARALWIDATGHVDAHDVQTGVDRDGTLDHPDDYDEEWVIEAAVPLASLGPPPLAIVVRRCDTTKDGKQRCGRWHARLPLQ